MILLCALASVLWLVFLIVLWLVAGAGDAGREPDADLIGSPALCSVKLDTGCCLTHFETQNAKKYTAVPLASDFQKGRSIPCYYHKYH
ncbi:MAG: hypothetical protein QM741_13670 [Rudaea sp.]|uniref:hypothetical protein n=1 Tax=Rudaea sp. TaxID=2136325 RepID=UPI0039E356F4